MQPVHLSEQYEMVLKCTPTVRRNLIYVRAPSAGPHVRRRSTYGPKFKLCIIRSFEDPMNGFCLWAKFLVVLPSVAGRRAQVEPVSYRKFGRLTISIEPKCYRHTSRTSDLQCFRFSFVVRRNLSVYQPCFSSRPISMHLYALFTPLNLMLLFASSNFSRP